MEDMNRDFVERSEKCKHWDKCSAPLCPLNLNKGIWYPNEEVCSNRKFFGLQWVKNQKKIAKRAGDKDSFFTVNMLDRKITIRTGIKGLNPDTANEADEAKWIEEHPPKKVLTEEEKIKVSQRLRRA